jgi:NAD(P)-binding Rossmann-like domain/Flavin containing amine oxidoreductase/Squalene-hopene cyclase C-terminal domain
MTDRPDALGRSARRPPAAPFDVVVVGGGAAGLTAAHQLRGARVLLLEADQRLGGRICTRRHGDLRFDVGAVLAGEDAALPWSMPASLRIGGDGQPGCLYDGRTYCGRDVLSLCAAVGLTAGEHRLLRRFAAGQDLDAGQLRGRAADLVSAFFEAFHFGQVIDYLPRRQRDALIRFSGEQRAAGQEEILSAPIAALDGRFRLGAQVRGVYEHADHVKITLVTGGSEAVLRASAAIIAIPGADVLPLLASPEEPCRSFLASLRYTQGIVVAVGLRGQRLPGISYVVTPRHEASVVLLSRRPAHDLTVALTYFPTRSARRLVRRDDRELVSTASRILREIDPDLARGDTVFASVQRWPRVGPVISPRSYGVFDLRSIRPGRRVFLAGDYACLPADSPLPYGIEAAVRSGQRAASEVEALLRGAKAAPRFESDALTDVTIYELSAQRPAFRWQTREGTIAFYGLILQAQPAEELRDYLLSRASADLLWEYQPGFGATPEDTALVLEGLLAAGVDREILRGSLARLVELSYDLDAGAFSSLSPERAGNPRLAQGRAAYWQGPSVEATAHVAYLLDLVSREEQEPVIESCCRFVASRQDRLGCWSCRWYPSLVIGTFLAVRLLCRRRPSHQAAIERASRWLLLCQRRNGSWFDSVIDTAAALLTLRHLAASGLGTRRAARQKGQEWLRSVRSAAGWHGEPVLYYWMERDGAKAFFHCQDRGKITTAWAELALAATATDGRPQPTAARTDRR